MTNTKIYISGPRDTDIPVQTTQAMAGVDFFLDRGFMPFCPHWFFLQHKLYPRSDEEWEQLAAGFLVECDALFRISGESELADREVRLATASGIPVFVDIESLLAFFNEA